MELYREKSSFSVHVPFSCINPYVILSARVKVNECHDQKVREVIETGNSSEFHRLTSVR